MNIDEMDLLDNVYSFLQDDKSKVFEEDPVEKFLKDIEENIEGSDPLGDVDEKCTVNGNKPRGRNPQRKYFGKYSCDKCEYKSDIENVIRFHNESVHLKIKNFICENCPHKTYRKQELQKHILSHHENERCRVLIIGCNRCDKNEEHESCDNKSLARENKQRNRKENEQKDRKTRGKKTDGKHGVVSKFRLGIF